MVVRNFIINIALFFEVVYISSYQWYCNKNLEPIVKEYIVVRSILENDTNYMKRLNGICTLLQEEDADKVFEYVEKHSRK